MFGASATVTVASFALWVPHYEIFGERDSGAWGLLIAVWVTGFVVAAFSGAMLLVLALHSLGRSILRRGIV
jgi:hypothetical protein